VTVAGKPFFVFLAVTLVVYHLLRRRRDKYLFLTVASWVFYAWAAPQYLWVLLLLTGIDYAAGLKIAAAADDRTRRRWLTLSVVSNLGLLAAFKYTAFVYDSGLTLARLFGADAPDRAWSLLLPLGISFHTFQGISYTVDVYRRQIPAVRSLIDYAFFVAFFPQLAAGPIVRAVEFLPQMTEPPTVTARQIADGIALFACGLFKKLVIADQLDGLFVSPVFADPGAFGPAAHRWAVAAWAVQIYCDFSGYSDIAVGVAKWFGFELPGNFNLPYLATSIPDFWRRWHLSLSTWLRDYLYFPLGGSRGSEARTYLNLLLVFVLCGLWHGAAWNWLVYGLFNGVLMCLHRGYDRALTGVGWASSVRASAGWQVVAWAGSAVLFLTGLILIRMDSWAGGWVLMQSLVGLGGSTAPSVLPPAVPLLVALGLAGHVVGLVRVGDWRLPDGVRTAGAAAGLAAVVVFAPGVGKTFIYIQF
jgi:D-alanyl-lipoteichoic acid acyltransferase DltB (MBOAT superfamily)